MSIHKSKGLEYPIVFVCGLGKRFNMMGINKNILLHQNLGFSSINNTYQKDNDSLVKRTSVNTIARYAFSKKIQNENISEEMRVFYVALTRAKEKLYLVGCQTKLHKTLNSINNFMPQNKMSIPQSLLKHNLTYMNFILCSLIRHKCFDNIIDFDNVQKNNFELFNDFSHWNIDIIKKNVIIDNMVKNSNKKNDFKGTLYSLVQSENREDDELKAHFDIKYNRVGTIIPLKILISDLKKLNYINNLTNTDGVEYYANDKFKSLETPSFMDKTSNDIATRKGTLLIKLWNI